MTPKVCPICCTESIEPMLRDTLLAAYVDGITYPSSGAVAYHCKEGHVFLLIGDRFKWGEAVRQGKGYSMIL